MALGNYYKESNPDTAIYFHTMAEKTAEKIPGADGELRQGGAILQKGWDNYIKTDYAQSLLLYERALKLSEKYISTDSKQIVIKAKQLKAGCVGNIGIVYFQHGNYAKTLEYYFKSLKINEETGNKRGQASNLGNIGNVYYNQGNYAKALEYYFQALKINEETGNKRGQASNLGNIGIVYSEQGNYAKALDYYFQALKINDEIGNKNGQASNLGNIGNVYHEQDNYTKALEYYFKALKINEEIGNKRSQAINLGNIGLVYSEQGNYAKSLEYFFKALKINEEIGNKRSQAINLENIGNTYLKLKQYNTAEQYLKQAEQLNRELGTIYYLKETCILLSELYEHQKKYKDALYYYKEYAKARDSLNSEQNRKALQTMELKYQYEKEQALKEKEHQKQLAIRQKEKERQKVITFAVTAGLILVLVFSIVVYNRLKITQKQKRIIEKQKEVVEQQKQLVEEKNKEIRDSIIYAKRIQNTILPTESRWKILLPDSFVLYLPKDIVAGDFYWLEETKDFIFVAAADCTGHGVPGAMVSVVCSNALTKSVLEEKIYDTNKILSRTRELVIERFTSEDNIRDGMDVCLIRITKKNPCSVQFSGANRNLLVFHEGNITEIKGDKQPIGRYENMKEFTYQDLKVPEGAMLYLTTDGFADQFGGEKGKKMGSKKFKEFLQETAGLSVAEQKERVKAYYFEWKQKEEQTDDVTVMGIKAG